MQKGRRVGGEGSRTGRGDSAGMRNKFHIPVAAVHSSPKGADLRCAMPRAWTLLAAGALTCSLFACVRREHRTPVSQSERARATTSPVALPGARGSDRAIDNDEGYADATDVVYLSGKGSDDAVPWDFMINSGRNAGRWSKLPVPSNWELFGFGTLAYGFNPSTEVGTYRRHFELPARFAGKRVLLVFEGALTDTSVTLNGRSAGPLHQGGFYRFRYDVTSLLRPGQNELEVVVAEQSADGSVNAAEREADYWTFGGIFRPVYLEAYPRPSIDRVAIDARADGKLAANVQLRDVRTSATLTVRVFDDQLRSVGAALRAVVAPGAAHVKLDGKYPGAAPWSAESPARYRIAVELEAADGARHQARENFGFRTLEVRPGQGIFVNGTRVTLRGANRASFWPDSGRALSDRLNRADVRRLKEMNMNAVRSAHYPPDRHFLDATDREGLYVLDELAGWQAPPYDTEIGRKLIEEMVTFDANHPSILFWNNGNEGGWNTALDGEFARHDPQGRPVLHPWATFSGINTDHYESYESTRAILAGPSLFMPTEMLHGLYDGGGGAGLDDYWRALHASPRGAGAFLWCFADEGVRRASGDIDTAGNSAPDGILGPYREREGSFYAVRDIWSPVQLLNQGPGAAFEGKLELENRYDATDLSTVKFDFELVRFDFASTRGGHRVLSRGTARSASIPPQQRGWLELSLPPHRQPAHALLLHAFDASGRAIGDWSIMLTTPAALAPELMAAPHPTKPSAMLTDAVFAVTNGATTYHFSKLSGELTQVTQAGRAFPLAHGPKLSVGSAKLEHIRGGHEGRDFVIRATYTGNLREVIWRVRSSGWLTLDYRYALSGRFDFFGIDFDCPESQVEAATWLGKGPSRVWKNRLRGPWHDLWHREKNEAAQGWDSREFKGYFADFHYLKLRTTAGRLEVVAGSPGLYLRLFTPQNGPNPMAATMRFPGGDLSFLHAIAPIGDKFLSPSELGPQGAQTEMNGERSGSLHFRFGH
jgi:hypothetical protein